MACVRGECIRRCQTTAGRKQVNVDNEEYEGDVGGVSCCVVCEHDRGVTWVAFDSCCMG